MYLPENYALVNGLDTTQYFEFNEGDIKKTNLGPDTRELEEDDGISRQKREAKMNYEENLRLEKDFLPSSHLF
ncbi:hypothetical protein L5515_017288 [Caenorhabditis briggsae]|uniref:Uncharacterized protein n=1 Tax=Caenorhabditis briggsae TaxID=6238 RepID=A0AAE9FDX8_CAEBR|nr:hypothetical protein L5515_017288 [Caenorhabditis briggsae]